MFKGPEYPNSLEEDVFNGWLEAGRQSKIGYKFLLVVWDDYESAYRPVYAEQKDEINRYTSDDSLRVRERLVAAYDLYSESKIV